MQNLNIHSLRDQEISINLIQYRNIYENEPTHEEHWLIVIFAEKVGFRNRDLVLVENGFYYVDDATLIPICEVSDQKTTNERIIPYLQSKIGHTELLSKDR